MTTEKSGTAPVAEANGIIGKALMEELSARPDWTTRALSRHPHTAAGAIAVDLTDADATRTTLAAARDTTHLFYAALAPQPNLAEADRVNGGDSAPSARRIGGRRCTAAARRSVSRAKVQANRLGPVPSPFTEDENSRHSGPYFYFT
ncbi:hypothetical protein [Methylobacterium sp. PvR107]|uniref:hypothetical protein n=1 Tax=Methylobacterium sp. PvR107 TaxID=2806597 RepID=UPI001B54A993|nr:hypothetical protein [Methylobacterium sp. PvR107]MBP1182849.1 hypothetical protein [Methylobacterium sp. PvR107]